jgi:hypothetical protein
MVCNQTITDTKLWVSFQAKADELLESAKIFVSNRIERDAQLLASVGLFAWERAVRDVGRALPAAGTSGAAVGEAVRKAAFQLGNASSFDDMQAILRGPKQAFEDLNVMEEFNTPLDEIKSVTRAIRDILNGEAPTFSSGRSLRTVAPAGQSKMGERQRRAYARRKQTTLKQEGTMNVGLGTLTDAAWQVKRELEVETSQPGYRTKTIRNAIEAGAQTTARLLGAAQEGKNLRQALFGVEQPQMAALESVAFFVDADDSAMVEATTVNEAIEEDEQEDDLEDVIFAPNDVFLPDSLLEEQNNVVLRLRRCIEQSQDTWLAADVLASVETDIDEDALRAVVTAMICARDELEEQEESLEIADINQLVTQLRKVKGMVDSVNSLAASAAGFAVGKRLSDIFYASDDSNDETAVLLSLDTIQAKYEADLKNASEEAASKTRQRRLEIAEIKRAREQRRMQAKREASERARAAIVAAARKAEEERRVQAKRDASEKAMVVSATQAKAAAKLAEGEIKRKVWFATVAETVEEEVDADDDGIYFANAIAVDTSSPDVYEAEYTTVDRSSSVYDPKVYAAEYVDVMEATVDRSNVRARIIVDDNDFSFKSSSVEIVSDSDYDSLKTAVVGDEEGNEDVKQKENVYVQLTLRSLDIFVLVLEKVLLVGVPSLLALGDTVSKRLEEVNRGGLGRIGWRRLDNSNSGAKRY